MKQSNKAKVSWLRTNTVRVSRIHFIYILLFAAQILVYDAWNLIAPISVMQRWIVTAAMLITTTAVWFLAHSRIRSTNIYKTLFGILLLQDVAVASFSVYSQRGMASRAVMLYAVPIIISTVLRNSRAVFATAAFCIAAYVTTTVSYFVLNFNEGYKIELYGEISFYCITFLLLAMLLSVIIRSRQNNSFRKT